MRLDGKGGKKAQTRRGLGVKLGRERAQECFKERDTLKFCPTQLQHGLLSSTYWEDTNAE